MIVEPTAGGYWLASGRFMGRQILAEGATRDEAFEAWIAVAKKPVQDMTLAEWADTLSSEYRSARLDFYRAAGLEPPCPVCGGIGRNPTSDPDSFTSCGYCRGKGVMDANKPGPTQPEDETEGVDPSFFLDTSLGTPHGQAAEDLRQADYSRPAKSGGTSGESCPACCGTGRGSMIASHIRFVSLCEHCLGRGRVDGVVKITEPRVDDPAARATNKQKSVAFEWLRSRSLSGGPDAWHAAVMLYEVSRLNEEVRRLRQAANRQEQRDP